jgi:hypothetical protein
MAGIEDCYTASRGSTKTLGNFVKVRSVQIMGPDLRFSAVMLGTGDIGMVSHTSPHKILRVSSSCNRKTDLEELS